MPHEPFARLIGQRQRGALGESDRTLLEAHLAECAECRALGEAAAGAEALLRRTVVEDEIGRVRRSLLLAVSFAAILGGIFVWLLDPIMPVPVALSFWGVGMLTIGVALTLSSRKQIRALRASGVSREAYLEVQRLYLDRRMRTLTTFFRWLPILGAILLVIWVLSAHPFRDGVQLPVHPALLGGIGALVASLVGRNSVLPRLRQERGALGSTTGGP